MTGGRPSLIDRVLRISDDGPITVAQHIANAMRAGSYFEPACMSAGIHRDTGYGWRNIAAKLRLRAQGQPLDKLTPKPTAHELKCISFSDAVDEAESAWEIGALATLEQLARGGIRVSKTVTKKDGKGDDAKILEVTETVEVLPPNAQVIEWRLARRFPARYSQHVEVTGAEGGPIQLSQEERAEELARNLESYLQGHADATPRRRKRRVVTPTDGQDPPGPA